MSIYLFINVCYTVSAEFDGIICSLAANDR